MATGPPISVLSKRDRQMNHEQPPADWKRWDEVLGLIASNMRRNDFESALRQVNRFLSDRATPEVRSSALGMKAELEEQLGNLEGARQDLLAARELVRAGFGRYVHELCLAEIYHKQGQATEAMRWCRMALNTGIEAKISVGGALKKLLELQGIDNLTEEDRTLCFAATERSWQALQLPGTPDVTDLAKAVSAIMSAEAKPPRTSAL